MTADQIRQDFENYEINYSLTSIMPIVGNGIMPNGKYRSETLQERFDVWCAAHEQYAKDSNRLDWLIEEQNAVVYTNNTKFWVVWLDGEDTSQNEYQIGTHPTARAAIDAAMAETKENK